MRRTLVFLALLLLIFSGLGAQDSSGIYQEELRPRIKLDEESIGLHTGICGTALSTPIAVRVSDQNGRPLVAYEVAFAHHGLARPG